MPSFVYILLLKRSKVELTTKNNLERFYQKSFNLSQHGASGLFFVHHKHHPRIV